MKRSILVPAVGGALAAGVVLAITTGKPGPYLAGGVVTAAVFVAIYWLYARAVRRR